jgi:hypothetical protein
VAHKKFFEENEDYKSDAYCLRAGNEDWLSKLAQTVGERFKAQQQKAAEEAKKKKEAEAKASAPTPVAPAQPVQTPEEKDQQILQNDVDRQKSLEEIKSKDTKRIIERAKAGKEAEQAPSPLDQLFEEYVTKPAFYTKDGGITIFINYKEKDGNKLPKGTLKNFINFVLAKNKEISDTARAAKASNQDINNADTFTQVFDQVDDNMRNYILYVAEVSSQKTIDDKQYEKWLAKPVAAIAEELAKSGRLCTDAIQSFKVIEQGFGSEGILGKVQEYPAHIPKPEALFKGIDNLRQFLYATSKTMEQFRDTYTNAKEADETFNRKSNVKYFLAKKASVLDLANKWLKSNKKSRFIREYIKALEELTTILSRVDSAVQKYMQFKILIDKMSEGAGDIQKSILSQIFTNFKYLNNKNRNLANTMDLRLPANDFPQTEHPVNAPGSQPAAEPAGSGEQPAGEPQNAPGDVSTAPAAPTTPANLAKDTLGVQIKQTSFKLKQLLENIPSKPNKIKPAIIDRLEKQMVENLQATPTAAIAGKWLKVSQKENN